MPRSFGIAVENNFVRGRITEATGLSFPENAVTDEQNCTFNIDGSVTRRFGIDFESSFQKNALSSVLGVKSGFVWQTAGNLGKNIFVVTQVGSTLDFYYVTDSALSANKKTFSIDLNSFKSLTATTDQEIREQKAELSSGNGYLFVAHPKCNPFYVEYNSTTDIISTSEIEIKIRDVYGIDDGLSVDERPSILTEKHKYNLYNQGWFDTAGVSTSGFGNVLVHWDNMRADFPSNSDIWWQYKDSSQNLNIDNVDKYSIGNTPASKGHYIFNAFDIDRNSIDPSVNTLAVESSLGARPSCTSFYAGRVWWSGVSVGEYSTKIYYSQIIQGVKDFGKCYQINDPTSEIQFDLLPTDGGIIVIPDAASIIKLAVIKDSLLAFASNGIWAVSGTDGGFKADDYKVSKISDTGIETPYSVVSIEGIPMWWNQEGIFTIQQDQIGSSFQILNISNQTIKSFFEEEIPNNSKRYAQGVYNRTDRIVQWLYRSTEASSFEDNFKYDKILNFNIDTQAFYVWSVDNTNSYICGALAIQGIGTKQENVDVTVSGNVVVVSVDDVFVVENTQQALSNVNKYLTIEGSNFTFSEEYDDSYTDWSSSLTGTVAYDSYFITGYRLRGESIRDFQSHYIEVTSKSDSDNSFFISGYWDYSLNSLTNKVTTRQQGYSHKTNRSYTTRKLRMRGNGPVLQFKVESQFGKPFNISGWATYDSVENNA